MHMPLIVTTIACPSFVACPQFVGISVQRAAFTLSKRLVACATGPCLLKMHLLMCSSTLIMSSNAVVSRKKRGPYKKSYTAADIMDALKTYNQAQRLPRPLTFQQATDQHGVPASTVRDYHHRARANASSPRYSNPTTVMETTVMSTRSGGNDRMLSDDMEAQLKAWIDKSCELTQPPTVALVRLKAKRLQLAEQCIAVTAENRFQMASHKWWRGFKTRYPT